eukprot:350863-Chlamydomonas_euryale.AAC.3
MEAVPPDADFDERKTCGWRQSLVFRTELSFLYLEDVFISYCGSGPDDSAQRRRMCRPSLRLQRCDCSKWAATSDSAQTWWGEGEREGLQVHPPSSPHAWLPLCCWGSSLKLSEPIA